MQERLDGAHFHKRGHRLGVFAAVASLVSVLAGFFVGIAAGHSEAGGVLMILGLLGVIFGYPLARLWYWVRAV